MESWGFTRTVSAPAEPAPGEPDIPDFTDYPSLAAWVFKHTDADPLSLEEIEQEGLDSPPNTFPKFISKDHILLWCKDRYYTDRFFTKY